MASDKSKGKHNNWPLWAEWRIVARRKGRFVKHFFADGIRSATQIFRELEREGLYDIEAQKR